MGSTFSSTDSSDPLKLYKDYFNDRIQQNKVVIFSQTTCGYCQLAKDLLDSVKIEYKTIELNVDSNCPKDDCKSLRRVLISQTNMKTVPQIFINGRLIGGYTELNNLVEKGELEKILNKK
jgi:glutaredoxin 3